jgi:hypothetical protein
MKRFFTFVAAAVMTSALATSTFAGWGPNGMYGNADPNARPVGQSSTPSTHRASAPILNPPDPTKNLGAVPGGYKDPSLGLTKAEQAARISKARAAFDIKNNSPKLAPAKMFRSPTNATLSSGNAGQSTKRSFDSSSVKSQYPNGIPFMPTSNKQSSGYGENNRPGSGFFGNDVLSRGQGNHYPQYPTNMGNNYPTGNSYPKQSQGGYGQSQSSYGQSSSGYGGQSSNSGWGGNAQTSGYGGQPSTSGYGGQSSSSGYGGVSSNSGYGMFGR